MPNPTRAESTKEAYIWIMNTESLYLAMGSLYRSTSGEGAFTRAFESWWVNNRHHLAGVSPYLRVSNVDVDALAADLYEAMRTE